MAILFRTAAMNISLSNRCVRLLLIGIVGIVLACSVGCRGGSIVADTYQGNGHEKGLMAHAGVLSLYEDGTAGFNGREGEWTYDKVTKTVQFTGGITFERVDYDPERGDLEVRLKPGLTRSHADRGVMTCAPMQE